MYRKWGIHIIGGDLMMDKKPLIKVLSERRKEKRKEEFLKTTESKLKKSEKDTWMVHNLDHLFDR